MKKGVFSLKHSIGARPASSTSDSAEITSAVPTPSDWSPSTAKGQCDSGCEVLSLRAFLIGRVPVYGRLARPDYTELHQLLEDTCGLSPF